MHKKTMSIICLLLLTTLLYSIHMIRAQGITLEVVDSTVKAHYSVSLYQNMTSLERLDVKFSAENLKGIEDAIRESVTRQTPNASVDKVQAELVVREHSMKVTLTFEVSGISKVVEDAVHIDCSWKSFEIPDDLKIQSLNFNRIGEHYLRLSIEPIANSSIAYFLLNDTRPISPLEALNTVGNLTMLDFNLYSRKIVDWDKNISFTDQNTRWHYVPANLFDLKIKLRGENLTGTLHASINSSAQIIAPGLADAVDDTLVIQKSRGVWTSIMVLVILVTLSSTIILYMVERRYRRR